MTTTTYQNIDPDELDKFSALAAHWWDPHSEFKTLHDINPLRLDFVDYCCRGLADKMLLDVGCGGGILSESMAKRGAKVTGIDMAEALINVAKLHLYESELSVNYLQMPVEQLADEKTEHFDVLTCMEMLEHVPDPFSIVKSCAQLVKPQGHLFFSTLNRTPKSYLFAIVGAEYVLKLLPKGTHHYRKFIKPAELGNWLRQAGLELKTIKGISYNPFTQDYRLTSDVSVNYLLHAQKL